MLLQIDQGGNFLSLHFHQHIEYLHSLAVFSFEVLFPLPQSHFVVTLQRKFTAFSVNAIFYAGEFVSSNNTLNEVFVVDNFGLRLH